MKSHFSKEIPKIINGSKLLKKLGFVSGKPYRYINKQGKSVTAVIQKIEGDKVFVKFGKGAVNQVPMNDFVKNKKYLCHSISFFVVSVKFYFKH
jgi:hypothetical protein